MELVAVNDLMTVENAAYLLKYDGVYGIYDKEVKIHENSLLVYGRKIRLLPSLTRS